MNKQDKQRIKGAVVKTLREYGKQLSLPIPIKAIVKSYRNVRLIPYSKQMKRRNLSYPDMLSLAGTEDAYTDYNVDLNQFIVYYNDCSEDIIRCNRYRWNIAHELAHIVLNHHRDYKESRIFRNSISQSLYRKLEDEADTFAAYILAPHIVLSFFPVQTCFDIATLCRISSSASQIRFKDFSIWKRRNRAEKYDFDILNLFSCYVESGHTSKRKRAWLNKFRHCQHCSTLVPLSHLFCKICGNKSSIIYSMEVAVMQYPGIELDANDRARECPVCHNDVPYEDGIFCIICGQCLINYCSESLGQFNSPRCRCAKALPGNARYCPFCGSKSTFLTRGILLTWDGNDPIDNSDDSELPF